MVLSFSTLSTSLNSLAGTIYTDIYKEFRPQEVSEKFASNMMKVLVIINGTIAVFLVFVVEKFGSILEMAVKFCGITFGPLLGLFTLGMMFPQANKKVCGYQKAC